MGLLNKFFETKYCSICGNAIPVLGNKKLMDGNCCKNCESLLSPFFKNRKLSTVDEIKYQIECRKANVTKLNNFHITRTIGTNTKVLIDENHGQFLISSSNNYKKDNADVIDCYSVTDCFIDIIESREEIRYIDSNDNIKSFNPPSYAYSYDFFIEISVDIPYIGTIRFKLNNDPVNNGQETLIKMEGGILNKFMDAFLPPKSNHGITSNSYEVQCSSKYQKYNQIANDIRNSLLNNYLRFPKPSPSAYIKMKCPWCGSSVTANEQDVCSHCGGPLDT